MYESKIIEQAARNIAKQISGVHASCIMANADALAAECNRIVSTGEPVLTEVQPAQPATEPQAEAEPQDEEPDTYTSGVVFNKPKKHFALSKIIK